MYIHTYFNTYQKNYKKKREGGLGGTKNSWYKWVTKTIMTQTQDTNTDIVKITQKRYRMHI